MTCLAGPGHSASNTFRSQSVQTVCEALSTWKQQLLCALMSVLYTSVACSRQGSLRAVVCRRKDSDRPGPCEGSHAIARVRARARARVCVSVCVRVCVCVCVCVCARERVYKSTTLRCFLFCPIYRVLLHKITYSHSFRPKPSVSEQYVKVQHRLHCRDPKCDPL